VAASFISNQVRNVAYWHKADNRGTAIVGATEIRVDMTRSGIILEAKIEAGDFDKLRSYILDGRGAENIFLASPGGDFAEAIKIRRFVRELKLTTSVPNKLRPASRCRLHATHGTEMI
jgi:hypothetical protein